MAQRIDLSHYLAHPQPRSIPSTTNHLEPFEPFMMPLQYEPDHDEIMLRLNTLSKNGIQILRLRRLFREPVLTAITDLLLRVEQQRLDPAYLFWAAAEFVPTPSAFAKSVSSNISSRIVSMASRDSGVSQLSGTTFGTSDTPTSHKEVDLWHNVHPDSVHAFPGPWSTFQDHVQKQQQQQPQPQHYPDPTMYSNDLAVHDHLDLADNTLLYETYNHENNFTPATHRSISGGEHMESQSMHNENSSGTFWIPDVDDVPVQPASVQPNQYVSDALPASLTPAYPNHLSPFEEGLTPASSQQTPQSSNAGLPRDADSTRRPSQVNLPTRMSKPSMATIKDAEFQNFNPDVFKKPVNKKDRSPCPHCSLTFESQPEFISHVTAEHEQPIKYECRHLNSNMKRCGYSTTRKAMMTRHHSDHHSGADECNMRHLCRRETTKPHPKRNWGCWWCPHHSTNIKSWAEHHMNRKLEGHQNRRKVQFTMLIRSLLLQEATAFWWEQEVQNLQNSTVYEYEFTWSADNTEARRLVTALETGWYQDQDLDQNESLQQLLVKELMDEAVKKPSHPITTSNKRAATSSPQGSKATESRARRDLDHQPSRSALNRMMVPGYDNAMQADFEKGKTIYQRPINRHDHLPKPCQ